MKRNEIDEMRSLLPLLLSIPEHHSQYSYSSAQTDPSLALIFSSVVSLSPLCYSSLFHYSALNSTALNCTVLSRTTGVDLNRRWNNPDPYYHPTVYHTKQLILRMKRVNSMSLFFSLLFLSSVDPSEGFIFIRAARASISS